MSKIMKIASCLLSFGTCIHVGQAYESPLTPEKQGVLNTVLLNEPYPKGSITLENNYFHLTGFPSFVQITKNGCKKLSEDLKSDYFSINVTFRHSKSDDPYTAYVLNKDFFGRLSKPGLYQPDYLPYADGSYHSLGCLGYPISGDLVKILQGKRHCVYKDDYSEIGYLYTNCSIDFFREKSALGELISIDGLLLQGGTPYASATNYFGEVPYDKKLRGIVFIMDATDDATTWLTSSRAVTEADLKAMTDSGELKIPIL